MSSSTTCTDATTCCWFASFVPTKLMIKSFWIILCWRFCCYIKSWLSQRLKTFLFEISTGCVVGFTWLLFLDKQIEWSGCSTNCLHPHGLKLAITKNKLNNNSYCYEISWSILMTFHFMVFQPILILFFCFFFLLSNNEYSIQ